MTIRAIIDRLRPCYLGDDWYRPWYRKGWVTGFHEGIDHGRRLWGVDDNLKAALWLLSDEDRQSALLAGATATRTHVARSLGLLSRDGERPAEFTDEMWAAAMKVAALPPERRPDAVWQLVRPRLHASA